VNAVSITSEDGVKIVLERAGLEQFWDLVERNYAQDDPFRWKYLAALVLREQAHWPIERIALALDHDKGHISRALQQIQSDLRQRFRAPPEWELDNPHSTSES
jgi:hypothetical protein